VVSSQWLVGPRTGNIPPRGRFGGSKVHNLSISCTSFLSSEAGVDHRSGVVSYGTILLGKLRIPAVNDSKGEGFVHVRCVFNVIISFWFLLIISSSVHDTPGKVGYAPHHYLPILIILQGPMLHSIFTDERDRDADGHPRDWEALQTRDTPLEFFNE
jgi:hypothetical protein